MTQLKKITVQGYKSIRELKNFELRNINILIGANGAGKSNFISLFRMLSELAEERLQLYVLKHGPDAILHHTRKMTEALSISLDFGHFCYDFNLGATHEDRLKFLQEKLLEIRKDTSKKLSSLGVGQVETNLSKYSDSLCKLARTAISGFGIYHFHDTGELAFIKQQSDSDDYRSLKPDARNLSAFLHRLENEFPQYYERIIDTIRLAMPFFGKFIFIHNPEANKIQLKWQDREGNEFLIHALSDGTLRFICLVTLLLQPSQFLPATILIDEPELGLHPYAINLLAALLQRAAETSQVIVATQSVELLNSFTPEDVVVADRKGNESTFKRLKKEDLEIWLEDYALGDLWLQNVFGGRP
jgi:predicted ATPase